MSFPYHRQTLAAIHSAWQWAPVSRRAPASLGEHGAEMCGWGEIAIWFPLQLEIQPSTCWGGHPPAARKAHPCRTTFPEHERCEETTSSLLSSLSRAPHSQLQHESFCSHHGVKPWLSHGSCSHQHSASGQDEKKCFSSCLLLLCCRRLFLWRGLQSIPPHLPQKQQLHPPPLPLQRVLGGLGSLGPRSEGLTRPHLEAQGCNPGKLHLFFQKHCSTVLSLSPC